MRIYRVKDYEKMSQKAASLLAAQIAAEPTSVLGLATGSTPEGTYGYLRKWYEEGTLDFSGIRTVNLDEYRGLERASAQSYYHFMREKLFRYINIEEAHTHIPNGEEADAKKVCREYEALIQSLGGVDLQLLGIGRNGHIGFNEPSDCFTKACHCVTLTESTIEANRRFFDKTEDVPKQAYTMGIGTIMGAKKILLLASSQEKAKALSEALLGPVTPRMPASILQFHPNVTVVADEEAMGMMDRASGSSM